MSATRCPVARPAPLSTRRPLLSLALAVVCGAPTPAALRAQAPPDAPLIRITGGSFVPAVPAAGPVTAELVGVRGDSLLLRLEGGERIHALAPDGWAVLERREPAAEEGSRWALGWALGLVGGALLGASLYEPEYKNVCESIGEAFGRALAGEACPLRQVNSRAGSLAQGAALGGLLGGAIGMTMKTGTSGETWVEVDPASLLGGGTPAVTVGGSVSVR